MWALESCKKSSYDSSLWKYLQIKLKSFIVKIIGVYLWIQSVSIISHYHKTKIVLLVMEVFLRWFSWGYLVHRNLVSIHWLQSRIIKFWVCTHHFRILDTLLLYHTALSANIIVYPSQNNMLQYVQMFELFKRNRLSQHFTMLHLEITALF